MKKKALLLSGMLVLIISVVSHSMFGQETPKQEEMKFAQVKVNGMACPFCAYGLEKKLKAIDGVKEIDIDVENGIASLEFETDKVADKKTIEEAVTKAGFTPDSVTFLAKLPEKQKNP